MKILQVMPIIIPHTSDSVSSCGEIPQWIANTIYILFALILLGLLIILIKIIFDF